ncbi:MAG: uncharacterized protein QG608_1124 [Actinomycetota bacterium]|nr:uncharacterized protein [Actinomycetota bacterium]
MAAQGFAVGRPDGRITARHLQRVIDTLGVVQIDSVNVLSRSHYLPFFSRLGAYPREGLDRASARSPRRLVEYWAHEASFVPPSTHRLLRFRMAAARQEAWGKMAGAAREHPELLDGIRDLVSRRGPLTAVGLERELLGGRTAKSTGWWNWSLTKKAVEYLFWAGELTSAGRTPQFERKYDLVERVLPPEASSAPTLEPADAVRELLRIASRALGVADEPSLRDYFRLRTDQVRGPLSDLVDAGELVPVRVQGLPRPLYLHAGARHPRRVEARALLSPFDSLIWNRRRTEDLFGFRYRLEVYTPAPRRVHGYYVLPFLRGDRLVARVDLKADRGSSPPALLVRAAWAEMPDPGRPGTRPGPGTRGTPAPEEVAEDLARELTLMARWLDLDRITVEPLGDLAPALSRALSRAPSAATGER